VKYRSGSKDAAIGIVGSGGACYDREPIRPREEFVPRPLGLIRQEYATREQLHFDLEIAAYPEAYSVGVLLNGAPSSDRRRHRTLREALAWGARTADDQIRRFGLPPVQLSLDDLLREVELRIAESPGG
jgi:hypothetical protein